MGLLQKPPAQHRHPVCVIVEGAIRSTKLRGYLAQNFQCVFAVRLIMDLNSPQETNERSQLLAKVPSVVPKWMFAPKYLVWLQVPFVQKETLLVFKQV